MARSAKKNKQGFYRYLSQKRKVHKGVPTLVSDTARLVTAYKEKAEILITTICTLVFPGNCSPHSPQIFGLVGGNQGSNVPPTVSKDQVCDHLKNLNIHKSIGLDEVHPRVLRELADAVVKPLSIVFEKSWKSGEVPGDWKCGNIILIFNKGKKDDPGKY